MIDDRTLERVVEFHGHMCPGLAMGVQAATIALREIGPHSKDEEIVAVVETDMCGVDAIQYLTGCTFGKGNLVHRDWGKNAYTFFRRSDGKAVRIAGRPGAWRRDSEHQVLFSRVRSHEATEQETVRFQAMHRDLSHELLQTAPEELFVVEEIHAQPPRPARVHASVPCGRCGEEVMETRIRRFAGQELCQPCFEAAIAAP